MEPIEYARLTPPRLDQVRKTLEWLEGKIPTWADADAVEEGVCEALTNAIVHGALEVSSELRKEDVTRYLKAIQLAEQDERNRKRLVLVGLLVTDDNLRITLAWEGAPYAQRSRIEQPGVRVSGFGSALIRETFDAVVWRPDGLAVSLTLEQS